MKDKLTKIMDSIFFALTSRWPTEVSIEELEKSVGLGIRRGPFYLGGRFYKDDIEKLLYELKKYQKTL